MSSTLRRLLRVLSNRWAVSVLVVITAILALYPAIMVAYGSFSTAPPGDHGSLSTIAFGLIGDGPTVRVLLTTLKLAIAQTVIAVPLGLFFAWVVAHTDTPGRKTFEALIILILFMPRLITALAWMLLAQPRTGLINVMVSALLGSDVTAVNIFSFWGVVWHMTQYSVAFLFLFLVGPMRALNADLADASRISGSGRVRTYLRVTLPLLLPTLAGVTIISFAVAVENFDSPVLLGTPAGVDVLTTTIYSRVEARLPPDYAGASAIALVGVAILLLLVYVQSVAMRGKRFESVSARGFRPVEVRLGWRRWLTFAACWVYLAVSLILPVGQLAIGSLQKLIGSYAAKSYSFDSYRKLFHDDQFSQAFLNSLSYAAISASICVVLGLLISWVIVRRESRTGRVLDVMSWLPRGLPAIALAMGMLWGYTILPGAFNLYGTQSLLIIAYVTICLPLCVRTMTGSFRQIAEALEEASRVHGASWTRTFLTILVAIVRRSALTTWVLMFVISFGELPASSLLYSSGHVTVAVWMLQAWNQGQTSEIVAAAFVVLIAALIMRALELGAARVLEAVLSRSRTADSQPSDLSRVDGLSVA